MPSQKLRQAVQGLAAGWSASAWWLRIVMVAIVFFSLRGIYYAVNPEQEYFASPSQNGAVEACVARGAEYFKLIGSYPTLQSDPNVGRSAEEVARARCERTITAF